MAVRDDQTVLLQDRLPYWLWLGPVLYMVVVGLYAVSRYAGLWAEADSATLTQIIRVFADEGRLVPARRSWVYPNGYSYQMISTSIMAVTGLDVITLQQLVYPLLSFAVVLPAWMMYREFIGSARGAALATVLLFTQPEFLFVILRSSHEKFTRTFTMLAIYLLLRSFKVRKQVGPFILHVAFFYLVVFALIVSNNLLAHSFIFALASALLFGWMIEKWRPSLRVPGLGLSKRLFYVSLTCLGLIYMIMFYVYRPAEHDLIVLQTTWNRIAALFLDVQTTGGQETTNAYAPVATGWLSLRVYLMVSIANWIILVLSLVLWLRQGWHYFKKNSPVGNHAEWFLWLAYAAFAAQGALSVIADASGALSSNIQHRLFPSVSMVAVALVGSALVRWRPRYFPSITRLSLAVGIFCIAILSILKATNEPFVSNKWTFYRKPELAALQWADNHLRYAEIWTEFDERLEVAYLTAHGPSVNRNNLRGFQVDSTTRSVLVTAVTRLRSLRLRVAPPITPDALRVYDNGEAELYRLRPQSPYQP